MSARARAHGDRTYYLVYRAVRWMSWRAIADDPNHAIYPLVVSVKSVCDFLDYNGFGPVSEGAVRYRLRLLVGDGVLKGDTSKGFTLEETRRYLETMRQEQERLQVERVKQLEELLAQMPMVGGMNRMTVGSTGFVNFTLGFDQMMLLLKLAKRGNDRVLDSAAVMTEGPGLRLTEEECEALVNSWGGVMPGGQFLFEKLMRYLDDKHEERMTRKEAG